MTRLKGCLVILACIIFVSGCDINGVVTSLLDQSDKTNDTEKIKVDYVIDGDTFVSDDEKYRLLLVDTPETVHPDKGVQPYGKEASNFTKNALEGQTVEIAYDVEKKDPYGRNLVYVYKNNHSFNETLLKEGYAKVVVFKPNTKYASKYKKIEQEAQSHNKGMWKYQR